MLARPPLQADGALRNAALRRSSEPGDGCSSTAHLAGTRELLHVLAGRLTLTVEDETHLAGPGPTVLFCWDREHWYANEADEQVRLLMVVSTPAPGSWAPRPRARRGALGLGPSLGAGQRPEWASPAASISQRGATGESEKSRLGRIGP